MKLTAATGFIIISLFFGSCTTFRVARPIYPSSINPDREAREVPSLQPLLSWEPTADFVVSYDVIIYEITVDSSKKNNIKRSPGGKIYYRENIYGNAHIVQAVLRPDTEYFWTFRIRDGNNVSDWASYDYRSALFFHLKVKDSFHRFKTPYMRPLTFQPFNPLDHW